MAPTADRKAQLIAAATAFFDGLARKDMTFLPWLETVVFRAPLLPGGRRGSDNRQGYCDSLLTALGPHLGEVRIVGHLLSEDLTAIVTKAELAFLQPACTLRVANSFEVDADGRISAQENHFDPRPALG
jgi:hypothetical protein